MKPNKTKITILTFVALVLLAVFSPASTSQLYSEVFQRLVTIDDTYSNNLNPKLVYVQKMLIDTEALLDRFETKLSGELEDSDIEAISKIADELGIQIKFVENGDELRRKDDGSIEGGGVLVEFGRIMDSQVHSKAYGSIYIAREASGGAVYDFLKIFTYWKFLYKSTRWIS